MFDVFFEIRLFNFNFLKLNRVISPIKYWIKIINPEILILIKNAVKNERKKSDLILIFLSKYKSSIIFKKKYEHIIQNDKKGISLRLNWAWPKR